MYCFDIIQCKTGTNCLGNALDVRLLYKICQVCGLVDDINLKGYDRIHSMQLLPVFFGRKRVPGYF